MFLEVKATSVERTLGSTGGTKLRHIIFVIIESGMALFVMQLVRLVLSNISVSDAQWPVFGAAYDFVVVTTQMLTVIIMRSIYFYFFCFADNIYLARASHRQ